MMKSIIYSRVSTKDQTTFRQIDELKNVSGFDVVKVYQEKISGFSKSITEREQLQKALKYIDANNVKCIMVSEISRLGRNTHEVLNLIKELENKEVSIYIHNLGTTLSHNGAKDQIFTKLVVTIMADLARLESEQMSLRIKSGINARKSKGLTTGRKKGSIEDNEKFLSKHKDVIKKIKQGGFSSRDIQKACSCSPNTIQKVRDLLAEIA